MNQNGFSQNIWAQNISGYAQDIEQNTADILYNSSVIEENSANIAANSADIAANASDIVSTNALLQTARTDIQTISTAIQVPITPHTPIAGEIGYIDNVTASGFVLAGNTTTTVYNLPLLPPGTYAIDVTLRWAPSVGTSALMSCIWNVTDTLQYDAGFKSNYASGTQIRFTSVSRYITVPAGGASEQWYINCRASTTGDVVVNVYGQITRIA